MAGDTLFFRLSNPWNTVKNPNGQYLRKCVMENGACHVWDFCYVNGRLDGYFVVYDKKGDTSSYDVYKEGTLLKSWSLHPENDDSLEFVEKTAEFPGGDAAWGAYISNHINVKDNHPSGTVTVRWIINTEGKVEDVVILKGLSPEIDAEVIRVIQHSPRWHSAEQNHKKVRATRTQSLMF